MTEQLVIRGRTWLLGDNIDTDQIVSGKHLRLLDYHEMAKHTLEIPRPDFVRNVRPGDVVVAGRNFGSGSSREEAPQVLKVLGVGCVIAESFARIFYRNAFNIGLPAITLKSANRIIHDGEPIIVDLLAGTLQLPERDVQIKLGTIPEVMMELLRAGGAIAVYKSKKRMTQKTLKATRKNIL